MGWGFGLCILLSVACTSVVMWKHLPAPKTVAAKVQEDMVYGRVDGIDLKMDVYSPSNATGRPTPAVMYIHGGGWKLGGKSMLVMMPGPSELLRRGYLIVSIDYRLAPKYKFPAMLEDAQMALRFLQANAQRFNLDSHRIGVMGDSAGGHLAALLALTATSTRSQGSSTSNRVVAVVDFYGPSDFTSGDLHASKTTIRLLQDAFGATGADDPVLIRASPVSYISSNAPPFLILHGNRDGLVDIKQSEELQERLKAAGVDSTFIVITNFAHGYTPLGLKSSPDNAGLTKLVADFFDRTLR